MKKLLAFFILLVAFSSCEEDVKFNNPAVQGQKDNEFWKAVEYRATLEADGGMTITAYRETEVLTLRTSLTAPGTYTLGIDTFNKASFLTKIGDNTEISYSTGPQIGDGEIVITEFDHVTGTFSGTFRFNADKVGNNPLGNPTVNYQNGVFYKVPISIIGL
ncbi:DUF6252 family protein [Flavobacterium sp. '19STA2R22 D10 B1']|uniref:DUF6252 family protein n=1 Tax=Flavobacterium aerium TaxID=3037261 RepID=UPI00278C0840|nr:DUF6252 family protein [Flavobacterium sp. '19STA2R22 D10 B1']